MVKESNSAGITCSSQGATVQEERIQRGVQRQAVIRGFENMVNKKKFKHSVHTVLKKTEKRHTKLEISLPGRY